MPKSITLNINNEKTGSYLGRLFVGEPAQAVDVILDTGSSILALDGAKYNVKDDKNAHSTGLQQSAVYVLGCWTGDVYTTNVNLQSDGTEFNLNDVSLAVTQQKKDMFGNCDGILGLAYQPLDKGIEQVENGKVVKTTDTLVPYFTDLEKRAVVANIFSFYTLRCNPDVEEPSKNNGYLIIGGGVERKDLYSGEFQSVKITHEQYYNVNLKAIRVGEQENILVPPATSSDNPNCIVDSGTNGLVFPASAYNEVLRQFANINSQFSDIINQAVKSHSYLQSKLSLQGWPDIVVTLEGETGDVELNIKPDNYWQLNSGKNDSGELLAGFQFFGSAPMAILGLPLMNNYFTVFDRSANNGAGLVKFATIKERSL